MKKTLLAAILLMSTTLYAQKIILSKGQTITVTSTMNQEMNMDMQGTDMPMNNKINSSARIEVISLNADTIKLAYKLNRINLEMDFMGQAKSYDSDNPEDKDSEIGKETAENIGKEVFTAVNKNTGKSFHLANTDDDKKGAEENPFSGIMKSMSAQTEDDVAESVFYLLPLTTKAGDSWSDSTITDKSNKEYNHYTLISLKDGLANIKLITTKEASTTTEAQGMMMDVNLHSKSETTIEADTKTALVKKRNTVMTLSGSIEMMGMSMPFTSKATIAIDYK